MDRLRILDQGLYGRLVPVGDSEALAAAILATLDEPPDRERLRVRGAEFTVERAVDAYLDLLFPGSHVVHGQPCRPHSRPGGRDR